MSPRWRALGAVWLAGVLTGHCSGVAVLLRNTSEGAHGTWLQPCPVKPGCVGGTRVFQWLSRLSTRGVRGAGIRALSRSRFNWCKWSEPRGWRACGYVYTRVREASPSVRCPLRGKEDAAARPGVPHT